MLAGAVWVNRAKRKGFWPALRGPRGALGLKHGRRGLGGRSGRTRTNTNGHGQTRTDTDKHERTRTNTDGQGQTRTDRDGVDFSHYPKAEVKRVVGGQGRYDWESAG